VSSFSETLFRSKCAKRKASLEKTMQPGPIRMLSRGTIRRRFRHRRVTLIFARHEGTAVSYAPIKFLRALRCSDCGAWFYSIARLQEHGFVHAVNSGWFLGGECRLSSTRPVFVKSNRERQVWLERISMEERQKTAAIANGHPCGHLIGGAQITGYKSPATHRTWATPRKRRP
jgi:hypothetical protein